MIPYFEIPALTIFGFPIAQPFGLLVVTGILLGAGLIRRRAKEFKLPSDEIEGAIRWAVIVGFIGSHLVDIFLYYPARIEREGLLVLLKIWDGSSSYGGFFGAWVGLTIYYRFILKKPWLRQADIILQGLILGWVFGRLGCTVVRDHPGQFTSFFLGFQFPDGVRHNLGFYEFLFTLFILLPGMLLMHRYRPKAAPGTYVGWVSVLYAPVRFGMDYLRSTDLPGSDARYLSLTPAQYACIALMTYGIWQLNQLRQSRHV